MPKKTPYRDPPRLLTNTPNPLLPTELIKIYQAQQPRTQTPAPYAVLCAAHDTITLVASFPRAKLLANYPPEFCQECALLARAKSLTEHRP